MGQTLFRWGCYVCRQINFLQVEGDSVALLKAAEKFNRAVEFAATFQRSLRIIDSADGRNLLRFFAVSRLSQGIREAVVKRCAGVTALNLHHLQGLSEQFLSDVWTAFPALEEVSQGESVNHSLTHSFSGALWSVSGHYTGLCAGNESEFESLTAHWSAGMSSRYTCRIIRAVGEVTSDVDSSF